MERKAIETSSDDTPCPFKVGDKVFLEVEFISVNGAEAQVEYSEGPFTTTAFVPVESLYSKCHDCSRQEPKCAGDCNEGYGPCEQCQT